MLSALFKAFAQLGDPALRRVLRTGILAALGCWLGLAVAAHMVVHRMHLFDAEWADTGAGVALGLTAFVVPILFFSALATFVMSFGLDEVARVVEARHYPGLPPARAVGWRETLAGSARFLAVMVVVTTVAAPLYLALMLVGFGVALNYLVNGYLLGREYFELVAGRRLDPAAVALARRNHAGRLWLCGAIINFLFQVPLLNLTAPVIATAFMVHVVRAMGYSSPP